MTWKKNLNTHVKIVKKLKIKNKKEWGIVRHLKKNIKTKFEYDSSKMLNGCSKKDQIYITS